MLAGMNTTAANLHAFARLAAFCGSALLLCMPPSAAAGPPPDLGPRIGALVREALAEDGAPSASVAVVLGGKPIFAAAYGLARLTPRTPATPHTRYQLASLSKTFTAEAALRLEADGKLSLDDKVSRWLPDLPAADRATVRQLLSHTAGFPDHYPQTYPAGPRGRPTTPDAIIAEWGRHPLLFAPGDRFRYSNLNYLIAGRIVEKASGEPLFTFLQRRVFAPLGMDDTVDLDMTDARTPRLATGYVRDGLSPLRPAPAEGAGWSFGAGQVVTSAADLARWDAAFLARKLLDPRRTDEEVTPPTLADGSRSPYALGLFISSRGGRRIYYHSGQGLGFLTLNRIYPAEQAAVVVLTNDSSSLAFQHIADRIAHLILPPTPAEAEAEAIFTGLQQGRPDRSRFSEDLDAYFDRGRVTRLAESLRPLGPLKSLALRSEDITDGLTTRTFDAAAGRKRLTITIQILADGRIESFDLRQTAS